MNKSCENCSLYTQTTDQQTCGYCGFWKKDVVSNDYCVEFKRREEEDK